MNNPNPLKSPLILQSSASNKTRSHFASDAYRISKHNTTCISMNAIDTASCDKSLMPSGPDKDKLIKNLGHRDGFQLVAPANDASIKKQLHNQQYALANLDNTTILNSTIFSTGALQGIFSSDGIINGLTIQGCSITTNGDHYITINGLMGKGIFKDNYDQLGNPVPTMLNPARIAGGHNIWINSFKDEDYQPAKGENITDNRDKKHRRGNIYLKNFDLQAFRHEIENNLPYPKGKGATTKYCQNLKRLALKIGVQT